jgi:acid phosphatase
LVLSGPDWKAGRLAVVVTFDEVGGSGGGALLTVVVAPSLHGARVGTPLSHLSWCRWMTDLVGAAPLRDAARATSLGKAFHL